jgi:hypothetical protein
MVVMGFTDPEKETIMAMARCVPYALRDEYLARFFVLLRNAKKQNERTVAQAANLAVRQVLDLHASQKDVA